MHNETVISICDIYMCAADLFKRARIADGKWGERSYGNPPASAAIINARAYFANEIDFASANFGRVVQKWHNISPIVHFWIFCSTLTCSSNYFTYSQIANAVFFSCELPSIDCLIKSPAPASEIEWCHHHHQSFRQATTSPGDRELLIQ